MGLGESSLEGDFTWLAYCGTKVDMGPMNTRTSVGVQFIGRGY